MDINNTYQIDNNIPSRTSSGGSFGYDLEKEKQRIFSGIEEIKKEISDRFLEKYINAQIYPAPISSMHPEVVDFLLSFNLVSVYDNIARQASLDAKGRNALPRIVWQIAQSKNWESLDQVLEANLPLVHSAHIAVVNLLKQDILNKIQTLSEKSIVQRVASEQLQKKIIQLPLAQALSQYPKIGEQIIGSSQIKIRAFSVPVRASIKNWIVDFHDAMGSGKHSPIDRGNFLFHSENGKKLTPPERQKVALILKSLEDGTPLTVDVDAQTVVFENASESNVDNRTRPIEQKTYSQSPAKEERVESFFQIPESKPPIGSDEFHVEIPEKEVVANETMKNGYSEEDNKESLLKKLRERSFAFMKNDSSEASNENSKQETQNVQKNFSPNFAANDGKISFSSAQKLPVEQSVASDFSILQTPQPSQAQQQASPQQAGKVFETEQIPQVKKPTQAPISPYRIVPSSYAQQRNSAEPKVQGNVVDLKN